MPVAAADGALGIEARHTFNGLTLNDRTVMPRYEIKRIRGLHDLPEMDDFREPNTERVGETVYTSYARGKTVVYEGVVKGRTLQEMRQAEQDLRDAFGPNVTTGALEEHRMVITPHASYGSQRHTFLAICRLVTLEDEQNTPRFERAFVIDLRLADPRIYEWDGTTATNPKW